MRSINLLLSFSLIICITITVNAYANIQQDALRQLDKNISRDEDSYQRLLQQKQQESFSDKPSVVETKEPDYDETRGGACYVIKQITILDNTILSDKELISLKQGYINQCLDNGQINSLAKAITDYYLSHGYVTSRIVIPPQDIRDGSLKLQAVEGIIEDFNLNQNKLKDRLRTYSAFPNLKTNPLNLRDIEQGLDQINRLASSDAEMKLIPGSSNATSIVKLTNNESKQGRLNIGIDNSGQKNTGQLKSFARLDYDNLFNINDSLNLSYNTDAEDDGNELGSKVYSGNLSLIYGYWGLNIDSSYSEYLMTLKVAPQNIQFSGNSTSYGIELNRVIARGKDYKTTFYTGLRHKDTKSYAIDALIPGQSRKLSILNIGVDNSYSIFNSIIYNKISFERGVKLLNAKIDAPNLSFANPRAQFNKITLNSNLSKAINLNKLQLNYRGNFQAQYSHDPLFSSEQIIIGDQHTVRGFKVNSITGDTGYFLHNDLALPLNTLSNNKTFHNMTTGLEIYLGLDAGYARQRGGKQLTGNYDQGYISGYAIGFRSNLDLINFDIALAKPIKSPFDDKNTELYFYVGTRFGF